MSIWFVFRVQPWAAESVWGSEMLVSGKAAWCRFKCCSCVGTLIWCHEWTRLSSLVKKTEPQWKLFTEVQARCTKNCAKEEKWRTNKNNYPATFHWKQCYHTGTAAVLEHFGQEFEIPCTHSKVVLPYNEILKTFDIEAARKHHEFLYLLQEHKNEMIELEEQLKSIEKHQ